MYTVVVTGWEQGLDKVALTKAIRRHTGLGLAATKAIKNSLGPFQNSKKPAWTVAMDPIPKSLDMRCIALQCGGWFEDRRELSHPRSVHILLVHTGDSRLTGNKISSTSAPSPPFFPIFQLRRALSSSHKTILTYIHFPSSPFQATFTFLTKTFTNCVPYYRVRFAKPAPPFSLYEAQLQLTVC